MSKANHFSSRLPGLYQYSMTDRRRLLESRSGLAQDTLDVFERADGLALSDADLMIENAIGVFQLPIGVAANFIIDGIPVLVPMVTEEPSIIAAASHMARLASLTGGFITDADLPVMRGQIQLLDVVDSDFVLSQIKQHKAALILEANTICANLVARGGGCVDISARVLAKRVNDDDVMMVVDVFLDCRDAMGANLINTVVEALSVKIAALTRCRVGARILSNLADSRLARAKCKIPYKALASDITLDNGQEVAKAIVDTYRFAERDPYRACTHNKGIFNGIDAVAIATGNDWRALEAGGHAFAARTGNYLPLSCYWLDDVNQMLMCSIELPIAVGVVGGSTRVHSGVRTALDMLQGFGKNSGQLARLMAAVGLAENIGSLRALSCEGIQKGHMMLHLRKLEGLK